MIAAAAGTGLFGISSSVVGTGVFGRADSTTGNTNGVVGFAASPTGFAVLASGRFKATGRTFLGAPNTAPTDGDLNNGSISFYLDQAANQLKVRVRYSGGALRTGTVNLV